MSEQAIVISALMHSNSSKSNEMKCRNKHTLLLKYSIKVWIILLKILYAWELRVCSFFSSSFLSFCVPSMCCHVSLMVIPFHLHYALNSRRLLCVCISLCHIFHHAGLLFYSIFIFTGFLIDIITFAYFLFYINMRSFFSFIFVRLSKWKNYTNLWFSLCVYVCMVNVLWGQIESKTHENFRIYLSITCILLSELSSRIELEIRSTFWWCKWKGHFHSLSCYFFLSSSLLLFLCLCRVLKRRPTKWVSESEFASIFSEFGYFVELDYPFSSWLIICAMAECCTQDRKINKNQRGYFRCVFEANEAHANERASVCSLMHQLCEFIQICRIRVSTQWKSRFINKERRTKWKRVSERWMR